MTPRDAPPAAGPSQAAGPSRAAGPYRAAAALVDRIAGLVRLAVGIFAGIILVFTAGAVLDRHLFKSSFDAYDQIARLSLVWMTFLGFALALRERHTIRVEILDGLLGPRGRLVRETAFDAGVLALSVLLLVKGWAVAEVGAFQDIIGTPFTYAWSYAAVPVAAGLLILFLALRIVGRLLGHEPDPPADPGHAEAPPC